MGCMDGLGAAYQLVFTVVCGGAGVVGAIGSSVELAAKRIDKQKHPILRTIAEVFGKTLQSAPAAFSLGLIGSFATAKPVLLVGVLAVGSVMVLTPLVNGIVQHSQNETLKKGMDILDRVVSVSSKVVNTAALTVGVALAINIPAALLCGAGITVLNVKAYQN